MLVNPFPQAMIFSGRNIEVCGKKVRSYKNRKLPQVILIESGTERRKEVQEHVKKMSEKFSLWPCVAIIS